MRHVKLYEGMILVTVANSHGTLAYRLARAVTTKLNKQNAELNILEECRAFSSVAGRFLHYFKLVISTLTIVPGIARAIADYLQHDAGGSSSGFFRDYHIEKNIILIADGILDHLGKQHTYNDIKTGEVSLVIPVKDQSPKTVKAKKCTGTTEMTVYVTDKGEYILVDRGPFGDKLNHGVLLFDRNTNKENAEKLLRQMVDLGQEITQRPQPAAAYNSQAKTSKKPETVTRATKHNAKSLQDRINKLNERLTKLQAQETELQALDTSQENAIEDDDLLRTNDRKLEQKWRTSKEVFNETLQTKPQPYPGSITFKQMFNAQISAQAPGETEKGSGVKFVYALNEHSLWYLDGSNNWSKVKEEDLNQELEANNFKLAGYVKIGSKDKPLIYLQSLLYRYSSRLNETLTLRSKYSKQYSPETLGQVENIMAKAECFRVANNRLKKHPPTLSVKLSLINKTNKVKLSRVSDVKTVPKLTGETIRDQAKCLSNMIGAALEETRKNLDSTRQKLIKLKLEAEEYTARNDINHDEEQFRKLITANKDKPREASLNKEHVSITSQAVGTSETTPRDKGFSKSGNTPSTTQRASTPPQHTVGTFSPTTQGKVSFASPLSTNVTTNVTLHPGVNRETTPRDKPSLNATPATQRASIPPQHTVGTSNPTTQGDVSSASPLSTNVTLPPAGTRSETIYFDSSKGVITTEAPSIRSRILAVFGPFLNDCPSNVENIKTYYKDNLKKLDEAKAKALFVSINKIVEQEYDGSETFRLAIDQLIELFKIQVKLVGIAEAVSPNSITYKKISKAFCDYHQLSWNNFSPLDLLRSHEDLFPLEIRMVLFKYSLGVADTALVVMLKALKYSGYNLTVDKLERCLRYAGFTSDSVENATKFFQYRSGPTPEKNSFLTWNNGDLSFRYCGPGISEVGEQPEKFSSVDTVGKKLIGKIVIRKTNDGEDQIGVYAEKHADICFYRINGFRAGTSVADLRSHYDKKPSPILYFKEKDGSERAIPLRSEPFTVSIKGNFSSTLRKDLESFKNLHNKKQASLFLSEEGKRDYTYTEKAFLEYVHFKHSEEVRKEGYSTVIPD